MASLIRGITVTLYEKTVTGEDAFSVPVYDQTPVTVGNVLVSPVSDSSGDISDDNQLRGRREVYELSIPKENTNAWENSVVEFWGKKWRTFGPVLAYIEENVPLDWCRKVRVERYG
jgi:hypothetical protein